MSPSPSRRDEQILPSSLDGTKSHNQSMRRRTFNCLARRDADKRDLGHHVLCGTLQHKCCVACRGEPGDCGIGFRICVALHAKGLHPHRRSVAAMEM